MKAFVENWNGIYDTLIDKLTKSYELTDNPHEADIFLLWQDVRGDWLKFSRIVKNELKKPLLVMQHGRGAVRDYGPPNNFKLLADKLLVWGESERNRLLSYGIADDRIAVVGCPFFERLRKRNIERRGKNVLFVPVIANKEEPENLLVFHALKIWESENAISTINKYFEKMKTAWAWEENIMKDVPIEGGTDRRLWKKDIRPILPRWITHENGLVNVKLTGIHDAAQYQAPLIVTNQNDPDLMDGIIELLINIDVVVCLEEGTLQLLAAALGIPVIVADIFQYKNYGGCADYDRIEKIKTNSCYWTKDIRKIGLMVDHALANPQELSSQRKIVCEYEGGANLESVNGNILGIIKNLLKSEVDNPEKSKKIAIAA